MGRTILYILIGISVIGALAVMLLITPIERQGDIVTDSTDLTAEIPDGTEAEPVLPATATPADGLIEASAIPSKAADESSDENEMITFDLGTSIDGTILPGEYAHSMTVAGVDVYWSNDAHRLHVGLVSPGTGYVAIGFDPDRQMEGANFIIASMHEGELTIRDDYGHETLAHMEDTARGGQDNIITAAGNEWPDQTVIEFVIPLDSGDVMDKPLLPGHSYTVLVSYHSMLDSFSSQHTRRGSEQMQLDLP